MKTLNKNRRGIIFVIVIALLLLAFMLVSCECPNQDRHKACNSYKLYADYAGEPNRFICTITIDTVQGHEYIIAEEANGLGIIHAESCECRKAAKQGSLLDESETTNDFNW